ncbi:MAG: trigger factor [Acidimicrobiales bacterium]|nr:trigger factor [Acidimicrobiales bacterium]
MRSSVEALEGNKVKLSVEVDETEFDEAIGEAFRRIAKEVRIPGFRPGKAPRRILESRLGPEVGRQEALREALPEYYARAVGEHEVDVIAAPEIDITAGQDSGPVVFDAVVEVRPKIQVAGYGSLRVEIPSPDVTDEEIDAQVDRLRRQFGELQDVERPAAEGDHVTIDVAGAIGGEPVEGLSVDDYLYEVGSGAVVPELDEHLIGANVGDTVVFDAAHPDPDQTDPITFSVLVKAVKEQILPEATDEWAKEASEFDTLEELRADLRERVSNVKRVQAQLALREGVIDSLVQLVEDEAPAALVDGEVQRRLEDLAHRLQHQGATLEQYLDATGTAPQDMLEQLREQATSAVKADLAVRAVIEAEGIAADDDEVDDEIERLATRMGQPADEIRKQLERAGQVSAVRSDVTRGKALEWLADHAEVVDSDGAPIDRSSLEPPQVDAQPTDETDDTVEESE